MSQLEAHEVPLHKVFSSDYDFRIPDYQRPYAWDTEQASELLNDLMEAVGRDPSDPYFLGSIVLVKNKELPAAEVIDGQQRLTTLTILLAVVRDLTQDTDLRKELEGMIQQPGNVIRKLPARPRLTLRARDASFFQQYVQTAGGIATLISLKPDALSTDAQRAIQRNAKIFNDVLTARTDAYRLGLIQLAAQTFLVVVSTTDLESAHRTFSVMNARGLNLSAADIFKSLVVGQIPSSSTEEYARKWEDSEELIGRDDFSDLFLHMRLIISKQRAKLGLLKEFPEQVLNDYLSGRAEEFVDNVLVPYAKAYEQIRDQAYHSVAGAEKVNAWFKRLAQLDNSDWRPAALWALRNRSDDPVWLDAFLRKLERLAVSMFIRREWTTDRVTRYLELLRQLDDGLGLESPAFELSESERQSTLSALDGDVYGVKKTRKYVLLRLDEILAKSAGATYDHSIITVEHVLPQNPAVESNWRTAFTDPQREMWTHRLANLVLLNQAKNSEAQNFEFQTKKSKYFGGKRGVTVFALTNQVLQTQAWEPSMMEARQRELLSALSTEWELS